MLDTATGMCTVGTPLEYYSSYGLYVKREDMCCPGGPNFSKTRGVFAHIQKRSEQFIGVLDTSHSQGGWAVAKACSLLGKQCVLFYPVRKKDEGQDAKLPPQQRVAMELGAQLLPLPAGRSAILYHQAKKWLSNGAASIDDQYMMPNALKLCESVEETANEVTRTIVPPVKVVLISASSGTIAAGVIEGLFYKSWDGTVLVHLGYSRPERAVRNYIAEMSTISTMPLRIVDENYAYADKAKPGETPPFPCNEYYDLKAFRWWLAHGREHWGEALFWNIG